MPRICTSPPNLKLCRPRTHEAVSAITKLYGVYQSLDGELVSGPMFDSKRPAPAPPSIKFMVGKLTPLVPGIPTVAALNGCGGLSAAQCWLYATEKALS